MENSKLIQNTITMVVVLFLLTSLMDFVSSPDDLVGLIKKHGLLSLLAGILVSVAVHYINKRGSSGK